MLLPLFSDLMYIDHMENNYSDEKSKALKYRCPCCGYYTLPGAGEYDICPVCYWEDDPVQEDDPDLAGGANDLCLNECRENFGLYGACEKRYTGCVRKPLPEEMG